MLPVKLARHIRHVHWTTAIVFDLASNFAGPEAIMRSLAKLLLSGETAKAAWTYLGNFPKLFQELFTIERKAGQACFRYPPKGYL